MARRFQWKRARLRNRRVHKAKQGSGGLPSGSLKPAALSVVRTYMSIPRFSLLARETRPAYGMR